MPVNLDHAHIFATKPESTVSFFVDMFGAELIWDEVVAGARVIRLRIGRGFVSIYDQPPRRVRGGAFHHLGLETDDLDGLVRDMSAKGFIFRNPVREEAGFKYVMIAAPTIC